MSNGYTHIHTHKHTRTQEKRSNANLKTMALEMAYLNTEMGTQSPMRKEIENIDVHMNASRQILRNQI